MTPLRAHENHFFFIEGGYHFKPSRNGTARSHNGKIDTFSMAYACTFIEGTGFIEAELRQGVGPIIPLDERLQERISGLGCRCRRNDTFVGPEIACCYPCQEENGPSCQDPSENL